MTVPPLAHDRAGRRRGLLFFPALIVAQLLAPPCAGQPSADGQDGAAGGPAWTAGLNTDLVWADNVFGTDPSPADAILDGRCWLVWMPGHHLRFSTTGRLVRFRDNPSLDHGYLGAGGETQWVVNEGRQRFAAGALAGWRANADLYSPYDYREGLFYVLAKRYLSLPFTAQLRGDLASRVYPDSPLEDCVKGWVSARLNRSFPTRTSLTVDSRIGWKSYTTARADTLGGRRDRTVRPRVTLAELEMQLAQSLAARFAVRAGWSRAWLLETIDGARETAVFENPLYDDFSCEGDRFWAALKIILPWNCLAEIGAERREPSYTGRSAAMYDPANDVFLVDMDGNLMLTGEDRQDRVDRLRIWAEKRIIPRSGLSRLTLRANADYIDQTSNDLYYVWSGWMVSAGIVADF